MIVQGLHTDTHRHIKKMTRKYPNPLRTVEPYENPEKPDSKRVLLCSFRRWRRRVSQRAGSEVRFFCVALKASLRDRSWILGLGMARAYRVEGFLGQGCLDLQKGSTGVVSGFSLWLAQGFHKTCPAYLSCFGFVNLQTAAFPACLSILGERFRLFNSNYPRSLLIFIGNEGLVVCMLLAFTGSQGLERGGRHSEAQPRVGSIAAVTYSTV